MPLEKSKPPVPPKPPALSESCKPTVCVPPLNLPSPVSNGFEDHTECEAENKENDAPQESTAEESPPSCNSPLYFNMPHPENKPPEEQHKVDVSYEPQSSKVTHTLDKRSTFGDERYSQSLESGDEACCTKLAFLIHKKAKHIAQKPAKPPKPRRGSIDLPSSKNVTLRSVRKSDPQLKSFGDEIIRDHESIKFADDGVSETSSDYQDIDLSQVMKATKEKPNTIVSASVHESPSLLFDEPENKITEHEYEVIELPPEDECPSIVPTIMVSSSDQNGISEESNKSASALEQVCQVKSSNLESVVSNDVSSAASTISTKTKVKPKRPPPPKIKWVSPESKIENKVVKSEADAVCSEQTVPPENFSPMHATSDSKELCTSQDLSSHEETGVAKKFSTSDLTPNTAAELNKLSCPSKLQNLEKGSEELSALNIASEPHQENNVEQTTSVVSSEMSTSPIVPSSKENLPVMPTELQPQVDSDVPSDKQSLPITLSEVKAQIDSDVPSDKQSLPITLSEVQAQIDSDVPSDKQSLPVIPPVAQSKDVSESLQLPQALSGETQLGGSHEVPLDSQSVMSSPTKKPKPPRPPLPKIILERKQQFENETTASAPKVTKAGDKKNQDKAFKLQPMTKRPISLSPVSRKISKEAHVVPSSGSQKNAHQTVKRTESGSSKIVVRPQSPNTSNRPGSPQSPRNSSRPQSPQSPKSPTSPTQKKIPPARPPPPKVGPKPSKEKCLLADELRNVYTQTDCTFSLNNESQKNSSNDLGKNKEVERLEALAKEILNKHSLDKPDIPEKCHSKSAKNVSQIKSKLEEPPNPPPRIRRRRSRTAEIIRSISEEFRDTNRCRRSRSLSETDVLRKKADREAFDKVLSEKELKVKEETKQLEDGAKEVLTPTPVSEVIVKVATAKPLYTKVNKDSSKLKVHEKPLPAAPEGDKMRFRPLPAPPPPPRSKPKVTERLRDTGSGHCTESDAKSFDCLGSSDSPSVERNPSPVRSDRTLIVKLPDTQFLSELNQKLASKMQGPGQTNGLETRVKWAEENRVHLEDRKQSVEVDENANVPDSPVPSQAPEIIVKEVTPPVNSHPEKPKPGKRISKSTFYYPSSDHLSVDESRLGGTESPCTDVTSEKSRSSWYDDSDASGDIADVDTSGVEAASDADGQHAESPSLQRPKQKSKEKRPKSKFYCEVEEKESSTDGENQVLKTINIHSSVSPPESELYLHKVSKTESDDTDDLLEKAEVLQKEMKELLMRRQQKLEAGSAEDGDSAEKLEVADVQNESEMAADSPKIYSRKNDPNIHSSASEISWQASSDESDHEDCADVSKEEAAKQKRKKKIFYIANEIMTSEDVFVDALHLLNRDFRDQIAKASQEKGEKVIPDEMLDLILKHLPQLEVLNEKLLSELGERLTNWENCQKIADVVVKIGPFLKLYSAYIKDFETMTAALNEAKKRYPLFGQVVKDFELSPRCQKLAIHQYMLKPVQRIPQYRLLLQDYLNHLTEDSEDYKNAVDALNIVSQVANHANESMKLGDNFSKMLSIQQSILGNYEIVKPGRIFIKEGELMKLSRKGPQPRRMVLFSDTLLYLSQSNSGLYRITYELPLTGMKVSVPQQQEYQNEFSVITVKRSFSLAASSSKEREEWIETLNKAIEENAQRRSSFQKSPDKDGNLSIFSSAELGKQAPVWIPDARVTMCQLCTSEFTFTHRRHHCRACGKVICHSCSANRVPLPYVGNKTVRVCDDCFRQLNLPSVSSRPDTSESTDTDSSENSLNRKTPRLPRVLQEVPASDLDSRISGYLHYWTKKSWKRFWFVLKDKVLYRYRASEDVAALKSTPLLGFEIITPRQKIEGCNMDCVFELQHKGLESITFCADTPETADRWKQAMHEATQLN